MTRLSTLQAELEKGESFLRELREKQEETITTMRRVEGAIVVLNELLEGGGQ